MSNMTNTKTIARNTGWFSLENIINAGVAFTTSIAINRYLGPEKNSYLIFVSYIANFVSSLSGMGIPATTRKYMAEFIGVGSFAPLRRSFIDDKKRGRIPCHFQKIGQLGHGFQGK